MERRPKTPSQIEDILDDTFFLISSIKDPEFPQTLGELNVIQRENLSLEEIHFPPNDSYLTVIRITWVPTVPHCHLASQIGLSIITKLRQELLNFDDYKIDILVKEDTHQDKPNLDKQINDKERVSAAQENPTLMEFIDTLISERR